MTRTTLIIGLNLLGSLCGKIKAAWNREDFVKEISNHIVHLGWRFEIK